MYELNAGCGADLLFSTADAVWRQELARCFGADGIEAFRYRKEGQGEPFSLLRQAYEVREWAFRRWIVARAVPDVRYRQQREALTLLELLTTPEILAFAPPAPREPAANPSAPPAGCGSVDPVSPHGATSRGETVSQRFRAARERCAYDAPGLARLAGVEAVQILELESGASTTDPGDVEKIAQVLGIATDGTAVQTRRMWPLGAGDTRVLLASEDPTSAGAASAPCEADVGRTHVSWPACEGEMAERIRAYDWAETALGPAAEWSVSLKRMVELVLSSPLVSSLVCGPERLLIYNDTAALLYGACHPAALGRPLPETFPDGWRTVAPYYERVFAGEKITVVGQPLDTRGEGAARDVFDAFLIPIRDGGEVAYAYMIGAEVSECVRAQQRLVETARGWRD
ncbi:PAS domain-containing protein [Methylobacterium oxalidis]|uniref:PAS domain-containing protein n=1 Tax=Methylobacterium oxalidis TaxID=944322 RepID=UPI003315BA32